MSKISSGSLRDALKNKEVIPFVGSGVSRAIMRKDEKTPLFPTWWEFLSLAAERLEKEGKTAKANIIKSLLEDVPPDYLDIAQRSFDSLGVPLWNDLLTQTFKRDEKEADEKTLELAQLVWQLGSNLVFTTNIDDVLEWRSVKDERISLLDTQTDEFAELQRNEIKSPTLFYLHGRVADKRNIVFTRKQYEEFYDRQHNKAKLGALVSFLTLKPFLFIGFSLDDPYFVEQLKYIHEIYGGAASRFYVLLRKSEIGKLSHLNFVAEVPYEDFGEPLLEIMREMRDIANGDNNSGNSKLPLKNPEDLLRGYYLLDASEIQDLFLQAKNSKPRPTQKPKTNEEAKLSPAVKAEVHPESKTESVQESAAIISIPSNNSFWQEISKKEIAGIVGGAATVIGLAGGYITSAIQSAGVIDMALAHWLIFCAWIVVILGTAAFLFLYERLNSLSKVFRFMTLLVVVLISGFGLLLIDSWMVYKKAEAEKGVAKPTGKTVSSIQKMSDAELKSEVAAFVKSLYEFNQKMRAAEPDFVSPQLSIELRAAQTQEEKWKVAERNKELAEQKRKVWQQEFENEYNQHYYTRATELRDEMFKRIPPKDLERKRTVIYEGLAGPQPIREIASDLERLSNLLRD
ncbi:MAG TPA: SIR2 family protein [Pyrinomonadaceae bacterium]|jgi:hypothetical protein